MVVSAPQQGGNNEGVGYCFGCGFAIFWCIESSRQCRLLG
jgi:hypothetical protein